MRATTHSNTGNALARHGRYDQAVEQYRRALQFHPRHALAHNNLAAVLMRQGKLDESIFHYQQALQIQPNYALAKRGLVRARQRLQQGGQLQRKDAASNKG